MSSHAIVNLITFGTIVKTLAYWGKLGFGPTLGKLQVLGVTACQTLLMAIGNPREGYMLPFSIGTCFFRVHTEVLSSIIGVVYIASGSKYALWMMRY